MQTPAHRVAPSTQHIDGDLAWTLLLALRDQRDANSPTAGSIATTKAQNGTHTARAWSCTATVDTRGRWRASLPVTAVAARMLDLYASMVAPRATSTVAHLAQSLDGRIATESGSSQWVTGNENLTHVHRMRALCDAVIVGASTVQHDDPQLTTRRVQGPSPTRVVIDPRGRLPSHHRVFRDGSAPTLVVHSHGHRGSCLCHGEAECIDVAGEPDELNPRAILAALHERGLRHVLIEGGGVTVSRFLRARALDRLQIAVAPCLLGSGRPALTLPRIEKLDEAVRPRTRRVVMGDDVLFDCELYASGQSQAT